MRVTGEVKIKRFLADESKLNEKGRIILEKLGPIIYDGEQQRYLSVGGKVADAFRTGAEWKKKIEGNQHE